MLVWFVTYPHFMGLGTKFSFLGLISFQDHAFKCLFLHPKRKKKVGAAKCGDVNLVALWLKKNFNVVGPRKE